MMRDHRTSGGIAYLGLLLVLSLVLSGCNTSITNSHRAALPLQFVKPALVADQ